MGLVLSEWTSIDTVLAAPPTDSPHRKGTGSGSGSGSGLGLETSLRNVKGLTGTSTLLGTGISTVITILLLLVVVIIIIIIIIITIFHTTTTTTTRGLQRFR